MEFPAQQSSPPTYADHLESGEDVAIHQVAGEMQSVGAIVDDLKARVDEANREIGRVSVVRTAEVEIGRLFVQAQEFIDAALAHAERRANDAIHEAENEAERILDEARAEAQSIRDTARREGYLAPEAASRLDETITSFIGINAELVQELSYLRGRFNEPSALEVQSDTEHQIQSLEAALDPGAAAPSFPPGATNLQPGSVLGSTESPQEPSSQQLGVPQSWA